MRALLLDLAIEPMGVARVRTVATWPPPGTGWETQGFAAPRAALVTTEGRPMRSDLLTGEYAERTTTTEGTGESFVLQNPRMLKVTLKGGNMYARQGAMVAYQGGVDFDFEGGGVGKFFKKMVTGEGLPLMRVSGNGDVFFAHDAREVHLVFLENETITVNGDNLLAFDEGLTWDVKMVKKLSGMLAGGIFNTTITGTGWVALTAYGTPVTLNTDQPTFADMQSAIAWSGNLTTSIKRTVKMKALIGRGSGEIAQLAFEGNGWVIVQASEGPPMPQVSNS